MEFKNFSQLLFLFSFFFSKVPGISVFQKRLNCVAGAKQAGGEEGRGGEGEKRAKGKGRGSPFPSLPN